VSAGRLRLAFLAAALGMLAFCVTNLGFSTDITNFMPRDSDSELAVLSSLLADSEMTRTMVFSVGAAEPGTAIAAARELASRIEGHPEVAWIRSGVAEDHIRELYQLYFPRRLYFLSEEPETGVPALLADGVLRQRARDLKRDLGSPGAALWKRSAAEDPLAAFRRILERFRADQGELRLEDGHFMSRDGRFAIFFLGTVSSAFASRAQTELLEAIEGSFQEIADGHGGAVELELSGANRFAVDAERGIRSDLMWILPCTVIGVAGLFLVFFRSPHSLALALIPGVMGVLTATTAGILIFGGLDGLTIAFGTSLIGVAIDYPIHLINHHALAPAFEPAASTARRLRPSLMLGALTTMASFAGLTLTSFPGFREIGFFAIVGIAVALGVTLTLLPGLLPEGRPVPPFSRAVADRLGRAVLALGSRRAWLVVPPLVVVGLAFVSLPHLHWSDDLSQLSNLDPALQAEEIRVRERVSQFDSARFVIAVADDRATAVVLVDRVHRRLARAVRDGALESTRSLHGLLWSPELQRRNREIVLSDAGLYPRIDAIFAEEGFRSGAFAPFREHLEAAAPPPLVLADLERSALRDLLVPLVFPLGDRVAVVTYLRGVRSAPAIEQVLDGMEGVYLFDQRRFINEIYAEFRATTLRQIVIGSGLVILVLAVRYRRWRPTLAAFLPSLLVALLVLEIFAGFGVETNLLHVISLVMVMGMGVDYGIFIVDSTRDPETCGATMLSLLVSCLTTVLVFGSLATSSHPALRAIGTTTGLGILLSFLFAPLCLVWVGASGELEPGA
jgi:predicted exporter